MQNNTDAFSWKRGKDKSRKLKTNIPRKQSSFLLFSIGLYKDALQSQLQLCMTIKIVTLHKILMLKVKTHARHAFTLKQNNLF